jgi:arginyl-tRNA synthetase
MVGATIEFLRGKGDVYIGRLPPPKGQLPIDDYEDREQTLFRATAYGDDVDRPLLKSDGGYTYFASDIAYHKTSSTAASSTWSTSGAPITAAISSVCRRRSRR